MCVCVCVCLYIYICMYINIYLTDLMIWTQIIVQTTTTAPVTTAKRWKQPKRPSMNNEMMNE